MTDLNISSRNLPEDLDKPDALSDLLGKAFQHLASNDLKLDTHDELLGIHNPDTIQPGDLLRRSGWTSRENFRVIAVGPTMIFGIDQDGIDYALTRGKESAPWRWIKLS